MGKGISKYIKKSKSIISIGIAKTDFPVKKRLKMVQKLRRFFFIIVISGIFTNIALGEDIFLADYSSRNMILPGSLEDPKGVTGLITMGGIYKKGKVSFADNMQEPTIPSYNQDRKEISLSIIHLDLMIYYDTDDWRFSFDRNGLGVLRKSDVGNFSVYWGSTLGYISASEDTGTAYKDPFELNKKREKTDQKSDYGSFVYSYDSELFSFEIGVSSVTVHYKEDLTTQYEDLGRNTQTNSIYCSFRFAYLLMIGTSINQNAKGEADSAKGLEGTLMLAVPLDKKIYITAGMSEKALKYTKVHPIFILKREDHTSRTFASVSFLVNQDWSCSFDYGTENINSNIKFFDHQYQYGILTANYLF